MTRATLIGFGAVVLWAFLALFTVGSAPTPPLLLNTLCFAIGGSVGLVWTTLRGRLWVLRSVPLRVYAFGTLGLFGYHALYFSALRLAPPAQAGLIAYLWPLLIVLMSGLLPNERLKGGHVIGACLGLCGAAILFLDGTQTQAGATTGYLLAALCALTWSTYSVGSRIIGDAPTDSVSVFCLASAALSLPLHLMFETSALPSSITGWASIAALGLGPVGLAFYLWDIGMKNGNIQVLGAASYAAPLLSTVVLVIVGMAIPSWSLAGAALLISGGAVLAARASRQA